MPIFSVHRRFWPKKSQLTRKRGHTSLPLSDAQTWRNPCSTTDLTCKEVLQTLFPKGEAQRALKNWPWVNSCVCGHVHKASLFNAHRPVLCNNIYLSKTMVLHRIPSRKQANTAAESLLTFFIGGISLAEFALSGEACGESLVQQRNWDHWDVWEAVWRAQVDGKGGKTGRVLMCGDFSLFLHIES